MSKTLQLIMNPKEVIEAPACNLCAKASTIQVIERGVSNVEGLVSNSVRIFVFIKPVICFLVHVVKPLVLYSKCLGIEPYSFGE